MTAREISICKKILDTLHDTDGGQMIDLQIHAEVQVRAGGTIPLREFSAALAICDTRRWVTGVTARFASGSVKYNITDLGESARLEL